MARPSRNSTIRWYSRTMRTEIAATNSAAKATTPMTIPMIMCSLVSPSECGAEAAQQMVLGGRLGVLVVFFRPHPEADARSLDHLDPVPGLHVAVHRGGRPVLTPHPDDSGRGELGDGDPLGSRRGRGWPDPLSSVPWSLRPRQAIAPRPDRDGHVGPEEHPQNGLGPTGGRHHDQPHRGDDPEAEGGEVAVGADVEAQDRGDHHADRAGHRRQPTWRLQSLISRPHYRCAGRFCASGGAEIGPRRPAMLARVASSQLDMTAL